MRKKIIGHLAQPAQEPDGSWFDLQAVSRVELTSESEEHPIEAALDPERDGGWQAAEPGEQLLRFVFDSPARLRRIYLVFSDASHSRTQEFVLRWVSAATGHSQEILRQQYSFSPEGATREVEDFHVELDAVAALELSIVPDISGGGVRATLTELRVG